jgi:hypothetical protein
LKASRKYNIISHESTLVTFNEPSHLEGNPDYKRYGQSIIYDYKKNDFAVLSLNISTLKKHLNYDPPENDLFKEFVNDSNAWVQGRATIPYGDKILLFLNDTRSGNQLWATTITIKKTDGLMQDDYTIDYYPQSIKFHTGLSKIKNL